MKKYSRNYKCLLFVLSVLVSSKCRRLSSQWCVLSLQCVMSCLPQLADIHGNVFSFRLGSDKMVCASGYKMVKEAIVTQADNFVDRPYDPVTVRMYGGQSGLYTSSGFLLYICARERIKHYFLLQMVYSRAMVKYGRDSGALRCPPYETLVWAKTSWSRVSARRSDTYRRRSGVREVM